MLTFLKKSHRLIFYAAWLVINALQAMFTELQDDEAYYWVFSNYLDWGYFDHPPMIALLIKMGTSLFSGELAVRLFPLLLSTGTLLLTEKLTRKKNPLLFYCIALSLAVLQVSGFVAVPDVPLMFFTAMFFLLYRNWIAKASWKNTLLLGCVAAALLYCKYHGLLILFFVLLSNIKLIKEPKIYVAGLLALILFVPHLIWQYQHNWISFRYHLFESNVNAYKLSYTTDYLLGQLLLAGPLAGFILWPAAILYRTNNPLDKALKFTALGFLLFFLLSTIKGKVEPNWTSPAIIPLMVLAHQFLLGNFKWKQWLVRLLPITVILVLAFRVVMIVDVLPAKAIVERYHGWKHWPQQLKQQTKGLPVVFNNSYQRASKYWFYTGQLTYSLNKFDDRRNNYNFWPIEDSILGKPVFIMDIFDLDKFPVQVKTPLFTVGYRYDSSYHSYTKIQFGSQRCEVSEGDSLAVNFALRVPSHYAAYLQMHPTVNASVGLVVFKGRERIKIIETGYSLQQVLQARLTQMMVLPGLPKGEYFFRIGLMSDSDLYTHNSDKINLIVK